MSIKLKGSSDGSVSLDAPSDTSPSGTDVSFTLPTADGSNGQVLKTDGSGALSFTTISTDPDGAFRSTQVFTSSGTWTKPSGLTRVRVFVTGGGGGGGQPAANTNNGGGGAAGGTAIEVIEASSLGSTETVTIGAGGTKGNPGNTGGTSSFGSHCSATGGAGGSSDSSASQYVEGGVGSNGDLNLKGQGGEGGNPANSAGVGGVGGNSYWGGGAHGGSNYNRPHAGDGTLGGGGGGGFRTTAGAAGNGGAGGAGVVYVEQFF